MMFPPGLELTSRITQNKVKILTVIYINLSFVPPAPNSQTPSPSTLPPHHSASATTVASLPFLEELGTLLPKGFPPAIFSTYHAPEVWLISHLFHLRILANVTFLVRSFLDPI